MITLILLNVCFIIFIYNIYAYLFSRPENFPPGPPKVPWLGSYIFLLLLDRNHLHRAVNRICQFYKSTVIGFHMGSDPIIVVNDYESVKKALNHRDFDGRTDILMIRLRHPNFELHGIIGMDGDLWNEQRRFTLRYFRDFGFGRRFELFENEIENQISQLIDIVTNGPKYPHENKWFKKGKMLLPHAFGPWTLNCFLSILFNESLPRENMADLYTTVEKVIIFLRNTDTYGKLYSLLPSLAKYFPTLSDYKPSRDASMELYSIFKKLVNEQIETFDESLERHFIDKYINEMRRTENDSMSYFSVDQLVFACIDFIFPVAASLPSTLTFLMQQIFHEPEVQRKIQAELDQVIGQNRFPTLDDRINLPYTEACIREIIRMEPVNPSGVPHRTIVDTEFLGYNIPKGTIVITGIGAAMRDSKIYENPHEFHPERFLDAFGKLFISNDVTLAFGAGRRVCAGETFTRNMLFLFTTSFLQVFNVAMPKGEKPFKFSENLTGGIRTPKDHWVEVTAR